MVLAHQTLKPKLTGLEEKVTDLPLLIDITGLDVGLYDRLMEMGHRDYVVGINFAGKPLEPPPLGEDGKPGGGVANRRAEMWRNLRGALAGGPRTTALIDQSSILIEAGAEKAQNKKALDFSRGGRR